MKLIVIGCLLASAYSANLESQAGPQGQYFERTPNNNLVQIKYIGAGSGLNNAAFNSQNQRTGNFNQESNNQQFQNQVSSQNQRLNQINQQNQELNQFSQVSTQENQNLNQQKQVAAQFSQQNQGFSVNTEQFSFNDYQFANPNLVEVSFDENRHQQFIANQERQRQQFQTQPNQGQDFQNQQRQRQQQQQQQVQKQQQQLQHQLVQRQQQEQQRKRKQQTQQNQLNQHEHQRPTQVSQSKVQNNHPFFNRDIQQQSSRPQNNNQNKNQIRIIPVPEKVPSSSVVPQSHFPGQRHGQSQGPTRINHIYQFPQPIRTPKREIAGHLQRVGSDEIIGIFQPFTISVSASLFEGNVNSQFSCASQGQGFYADPSNNCQQFHVCTRVQGRNTPDLYRFTFQCADGEYFDQSALTCLPFAGPSSSSYCAASPSVYQSSRRNAWQLFSAFSAHPYSPGSTPPGICYLANNAQFVTGIRRK